MGGPLRPGDPERLGKYELVARLGEGGQGVVFEGRDPEGERVAVKLLRAQFSSDASARARFVRELEAAERVAGFCTAQVLDADAEGDQPYIVSEFVPGRSLAELVREEGPRTGADLYRLAIGTATALAAIHEAGIVHRDFKPPNVLMGPDSPRVIDFGIAKALDATGTMTSQVVGTPAYMAPEQVAGAAVGAHTDVFAWGATIVYAATGRSPFGSDTIPAVMHRVLHEQPDLSGLPQPLAGLVAACLSKDPGRRPTAPQLLLQLLRHQGAAPAGATAMLEQGASAATGTFSPGEVPFLPPSPPPPTVQTAPIAPTAPTLLRRSGVGSAVMTVTAVTLAATAVGLGVTFSFSAVALRPRTDFWIGSAYAMAVVAAVAPCGRLADAIGRKKVFLAGLAVYAVALMMGGAVQLAAPDVAEGWFQLLPRTLMGLGAAAALAPGLALLQDAFPGRRLGIAVGVWGTVLGVPDVLGPIASHLAGDLDAEWLLHFIAVPLVLLALVIGAFGVRESRREGAPRRTDVAGTVLLSLIGVGLVVGLRGGGTFGWTDWRALAGLVSAAALLIALVAVGAAVRPRLLPARLALTALAVLAGYGAVRLLDQALFYWVYRTGYSQGMGLGLKMLPLLVGALVTAPIVGVVNWRLGPRWPLAASTGLVALVTAGLTLAKPGHPSYPVVALWLVLQGIAWASFAVSAAAAIVGEAPGGLTGFASGLRELTSMTGVSLVSVYLAFRAHKGMIASSSAGERLSPALLHTPLLLAAGAALAAAVLAAFLRRPEPHPEASPEPVSGY